MKKPISPFTQRIEELTWKESFFRFYAPLKNPWFWAIATPFVAVMSSFNARYLTQAGEIDRRYNEMYGKTNVQFNYHSNNEEIYKMLDYLDANGVKVGDDMVRLSRNIDNFFDKLPF